MGSGLFGIGSSGLAAAYAGLQTTGHNIANVSTAGFRRQSTVQQAAIPNASTVGAIGNGVNVAAITHAYNELASREVYRAATRASEASTTSTFLARLDGLMGDSDTGIGRALDDFEASIQAMSASPSDSGLRSSFLGLARNLGLRFSETSDAIARLKSTARSDVSTTITHLNDLAKQVAQLNGRITLAGATGQTPNDLVDQRDELVRQIAGETHVTPIAQDDGSINLFIGSGQPLVVGSSSNSLAAITDLNDPAAVALTLRTVSGDVLIGPNGSFVGGKLGALMDLHNSGFGETDAELGRLAAVVATTLNAQHAKGVDLNGVAGGTLFALPAAKATAAQSNSGNAAVTLGIADATLLKASDYRLDFDGVQYSVTRLSDRTKQTFATLPQVVDGVQVTVVSGAMSAGDSFNLKTVSTRAAGLELAISDPRKIALALPVTAKPALANAGTLSAQAFAIDNASNANLKQPVTLTFTAAGLYNVTGTGTGNPSGQAYAPGTTIAFNGWSLTLSGSPKAGDTITIGPNTNLDGDNRNALALSRIADGKIADGMTLSEAFAATLAGIGSNARAANLDSRVQASIRDDAVATEQSWSGVNLDEEAAKMMQYQQAYQASAKVISAAQSIFDTLLSIGR